MQAGLLDPKHSPIYENALNAVKYGFTPDKEIVSICATELERSMLSFRFFSPQESACTDLDDLANNITLSAASALCYFANHCLNKSDDCAVIIAIRNEGPWLVEWVAHYRAMGVQKIIVFFNNLDDGSRPLIDALSKRGLITAIENEVSSPSLSQKKSVQYRFNAYWRCS